MKLYHDTVCISALFVTVPRDALDIPDDEM